MKLRHSPYLTLALLIAFGILAFFAHRDAVEVIVPRDQQSGYSPREMRQHTSFVAFQIKTNRVTVYSADQKKALGDLFAAKPELGQ